METVVEKIKNEISKLVLCEKNNLEGAIDEMINIFKEYKLDVEKLTALFDKQEKLVADIIEENRVLTEYLTKTFTTLQENEIDYPEKEEIRKNIYV